jgi:hypothetical protein
MILDIYSATGIGLLVLVPIWIVHTRMADLVSNKATAQVIRGVLVILGIMLALFMTADMKTGLMLNLLTALSWFGLVHLPVAMMLFITEVKNHENQKLRH